MTGEDLVSLLPLPGEKIYHLSKRITALQLSNPGGKVHRSELNLIKVYKLPACCKNGMTKQRRFLYTLSNE